MKVVITGGTGFLGGELVDALLKRGYNIHLLSRSKKNSGLKGLKYWQWDGTEIPSQIGAADLVINLAGASIAGKRWTDKYKAILRNSRLDSTKACVDYINKYSSNAIFLSASASGFYGGYREGVLSECALPGNDFMADLSKAWEKSAKGAQAKRTVLLRTSIVLGNKGGAFPKLIKPFKLYLGAVLGSGKQGFSWIHVKDWVRAVLFCIDNAEVSGAVNMVSPEVVSQKQFSKELAKSLGKPLCFRIPTWFLKLIFGEMSIVLWGGAYLHPQVLADAGFAFKFPVVKKALADLVS